ncbi:hypothetical protein [Phytohabitans rumicis]|uniref:hypothetical protein n=1 Tax=Phytohabitans rumicis TaxID=1076125 RepID=UPI001C49C811|nr:hypothetical protein [Phytohabitans rumicis]
MTISRRRLLQAGLFGVASATVGMTAACGDDDSSGSTGGDSKDLSLWYWSGGLSDKVVADVSTQFSDITFKATQVGAASRTSWSPRSPAASSCRTSPASRARTSRTSWARRASSST